MFDELEDWEDSPDDYNYCMWCGKEIHLSKSFCSDSCKEMNQIESNGWNLKHFQ